MGFLHRPRAFFVGVLRSKSRLYWFSVIVIAAVVPLAVEHFKDALQPVSDWSYQQLSELSPRPLRARYAKAVMIGDDEFWKGEPQGRTPLDRNYLARLVQALARTNAAVIAIDVIFPLPYPRATIRPGEIDAVPARYRDETTRLVKAIVQAAQTRPVVLAKMVSFAEDATSRKEHVNYLLDADILSVYGICTGLAPDGSWQNPGSPLVPLNEAARRHIRCGYVQLPARTMTLLPYPLAVPGGRVESFSLAIARAINPEIADEGSDRKLFGNYIPPRALLRSKAEIAAQSVLDLTETARNELSAKAAIIGGGWHRTAYDTGSKVDLWKTPVGMLSGVLVQLNYVEARLDSRAYGHSPPWWVRSVDFAFGLIAGFTLAWAGGVWMRGAAFLGLFVVLVWVEWFQLTWFASLFESVFVLIGLGLHLLVAKPADRACEAFEKRFAADGTHRDAGGHG